MDYGDQSPLFSKEENSLFMAASNSDTETLRRLLAEGVDPTVKINGFNSLHISCKKGNASVVQELLSHNKGSIIDIRTDNGRSPLMIAAFEGYLDITKLLHAHGASSTEVADDLGNLAIHFAAW